MNIIGKKGLARLSGLMAIILIFGLGFSLAACQKDSSAKNQGESGEALEQNSEVEAAEQEVVSPDEYAPDELEVEDSKPRSACVTAEERKYFPPEEMPPVPDAELSVEKRSAGYRLDYAMGYTYYLPEAWRELSEYISTDYPGNNDFADEPIYESRFFYYISPGNLLALDDLDFLDLPDEERAARRKEILAKRTPLFALILYRNDKLGDDLISLHESKEFPRRKVLKAHGDLTLVLARADYDDAAVGEAFITDYKSIYDNIETYVNSLSFFTPEDSKTVLQKRAKFDFQLEDLNGKSYKAKNLHSEDKNYILIWSDGAGMMRKYFESFDTVAKEHGYKGFYSIFKKPQNFTEEDKSRLFKYISKIDSQVPILLSDAELEENVLRFISFWPTLLVVDKRGEIIDVHFGVKTLENLREALR